MSKRTNAMDVALSAMRSDKGSKKRKVSKGVETIETNDRIDDKDVSYNFNVELLSVLCAYRDEYGAPSTRVDFVNNLLTLSPKGLREFINNYIKQYETYTNYYEAWKANPRLNTQHESYKKYKQISDMTTTEINPNRFDILRKAGHQLDDIKRYWLSKKFTVEQLREKLKSLGEYDPVLVDAFDAKKIRLILRTKYNKQPLPEQTAADKNRERMKLVRKLALLSGKTLEYYHEWPLEKLRKHLREDYWDEFSSRENMIDIIARATDRSRRDLERLSLQELEEEIERIDNQIGIQYSQLVTNIEPTRTNEEIQLLKCYTNYLKYDWIDAKVFDVFVHSSQQGYQAGEIRFRKYPKIKFGRPTMHFFRLLCNERAVKTQIDDRLLVKEHDNTVSFMIVFVVTGNLKDLKTEYGDNNVSRLGKPLVIDETHDGTPSIVEYKLPKQFIHSQDWNEKKRSRAEEFAEEFAKDNDPESAILPQSKNLFLLTQNEKLFEQETEFRRREQQDYDQNILRLLDQQIDQNSILIVKQYLGTKLQKFGSTKDEQVNDYVPNSDYVSKAVQSVANKDSSQTNRTFFQAIANITVYMSLIPAKTFRHRLTEQYYSPTVLMSLSSRDMLPEMYDEILDESPATEISRRNMATYIAEKINEAVYRLGTTLQRSFHPLHRRVDIAAYNVEPMLLLIEKRCENQCERPDVFYRDPDTGSIYCFTLHEIHGLINTDSNNPHTNKPFSQNFIDKMKATLKQVEYGLFRERKDDKIDANSKTLEEKNQLIIPTLWDIIYRQSREYIGNTSIFKFGDGDEPDLEENDRYFDRRVDDDEDDDDDVDDSDAETSSSMEDDEEIDDTNDVDDVDDDATMETVTEDDNVNDTDVEDDEDVKEKMGFGAASQNIDPTNQPNPINLANEKAIQCGTCNKGELQIKSIIFDEAGTKPKLITFCGIECFEMYDWPKYKRKQL